MRKIAALLVAVPLAAAAQESPPQYPPQAPPPQYAPPQQQPPAYPPPSYQPQPPPPQPYVRPQTRDSWYIGFGLGYADGSVKVPGETSMSFADYVGPSPTNVFLNFKVGATLSPKLLLGFDVTAARSQWEDSGSTASLQINNYNGVVTFFPVEKGFFLRGGAGLSIFNYNVDTPLFGASNSVSGVNLLGGLGYAFWLGQKFNLTLNLDVSGQSYGSSSDPLLPESSSFYSLYVGFDWY